MPPLKKLTLARCLKARSIEASALILVTKIAFNQRKGYVSSRGETFWDFASKIRRNIANINRRIRSQEGYAFDLCLKRTRTARGRVRDLYISTWGDRIIERWLNDCMNVLLDRWFSPHSYAYRIKDLGLDSCQDKIIKSVTRNSYFIKRDVSKFFYTIDQDILMEKIDGLVERNDPLYNLLQQRVKFKYHDGDGQPRQSTLGVPFGSPIACTLANIYLTDLDRAMGRLPIAYFRYADDFLLMADSPETALEAAKTLDDGFTALKLSSKHTHHQAMSFVDHPEFIRTTKFKHLGLEFSPDGTVRLPVEKQRKIINFHRRELQRVIPQMRGKPLDQRIAIAVAAANSVVTKRIGSAAIIDYYLKHVSDQAQLKQLDLLVASLVIAAILDKKFRYGDFSTVPFKRLRKAGLLSLRHRQRLHKHGHLKVSFLSIHNELIVDRYEALWSKRRDRINQMRISRKLRKSEHK